MKLDIHPPVDFAALMIVDYKSFLPAPLCSHSLALTLKHNVGSMLFNSGSLMVASAARPRYEWRRSAGYELDEWKEGGRGKGG